MIRRLNLQDDMTLQSVWQIQKIAYRIEAEMMEFHEIPPLLETIEQLRVVDELFYGWYTPSGELVGAISYAMEAPRELHIYRLMVSPSYFRQGIGRALMMHILDTPDVAKFIICTGVRNEPALSLYGSLGFHGVLDEEIAPGVYLRTMER